MLDVAIEHGRVILFIGDRVHGLDPQDAIKFGEEIINAAHAELHAQILAEARRLATDGNDFYNTDFVGL